MVIYFLANVRAGEREFLISPDYAQAHMNALGLHPSESRSQAKKAFDWMTEEQYHNIQVDDEKTTCLHEIYRFSSFFFSLIVLHF